MRKPSSASLSAIPRPMPREAPVTRACFCFRGIGFHHRTACEAGREACVTLISLMKRMMLTASGVVAGFAALAIFYPSQPTARPVTTTRASWFDTSPPLASLPPGDSGIDAAECDEPNGCGVAPDRDNEQQQGPNAPPPVP